MTTQPEALRLAEYHERAGAHHTAAELRRLSAVEAQRDALLEALRKHVELHDGDCICEDCAAIKAVEGETK